jgi:HEAT repeat protein
MARRWAGVLLAAVAVLAPGCSHKPPYEGRSVADLQRMLDDPNPTVRVQGAQGLSEHGAEARPAAPALAKALQSSDALLRQHAALALGAIGPDARDAVPALTGALDDPEWSVRRQAALALGEFGPAARPAAAALHRLKTGDPNGLVRKAAEQALPKIEGG